MAVYFLSDLHIVNKADPFYKRVLTLLNTQLQAGDIVVFGGDVFDVFVGSSQTFTSQYEAFFEAIRNLSAKGVTTHYIEGNHDFQLARAFQGIPNCQVHGDNAKFTADGKNFLVAHGDSVDPTDWTYLLLRHFFRSFFAKALLAIIPGDLLFWVGRHWSRYSREAQTAFPKDFSERQFERVRIAFRNFAAETIAGGTDFVVLGHSHESDEQIFPIQKGPSAGHSGVYRNMGFPKATGSVLKWTKTGSFEKIPV